MNTRLCLRVTAGTDGLEMRLLKTEQHRASNSDGRTGSTPTLVLLSQIDFVSNFGIC